MAKRKNKKNGSRKGGSLTGFFLQTTRFLLKVCPSFILIFALGMVFVGVREALYADPHLAVQKIVLEPSQSLSNNQREHLEQSLLGKNIIKLDIQRISNDLEKDPRIKNARVVKRLPSELGIEVNRRKPAVFVRLSPKGNFGVVAEDGMVLEVVGEKDIADVWIEAFASGLNEPMIGQRIRTRGFQEALRFKKAFEAHPIARYERIEKMILDPLGNLKVMMGQGLEVRLGRKASERMEALEKMVPLLAGEERKKIEYVDLQFDNVIVKQKRGVK